MPDIKMKKRDSGTGGEAVTQDHPLGCAVACVAFLTGKSYQRALKKFPRPDFAWTRGFYCPEIVTVLADSGLHYTWRKLNACTRHKPIPDGSMIFVGPSDRYQYGHFLVKCSERRYMNPWKNSPVMTPAKSGFDRLPYGTVTYVIEPE
jgi:hypothetical protein